jgi:hypothetical protein
LMFVFLHGTVVGNPPEIQSEVTGDTFLGASIGMPSFLAVSLETPVDRSLDIGIGAGSMILANSLTARLIYGSRDQGLKFRFYAGAVLMDVWYAEYCYDPTGTSAHGWAGVNLAWNTGEWRLVLDVGSLIGGDPDKGFGFTGLTPTWGISLLHSL